jgi:hypothetical protein
MSTKQIHDVLSWFYDEVELRVLGIHVPKFSSYNPLLEYIIEQEYNTEEPYSPVISSFHLKTTLGDYSAVYKDNEIWAFSFIHNGCTLKESHQLKHLTREDFNLDPPPLGARAVLTVARNLKHVLVDDFIEDPRYNTKDMKDARFFFLLRRLSATLQSDFADHIKMYKLLCWYEGEVYRVTGASRLGDIWLRKDQAQDTGYDKRVYVDECYDFKLSTD